MTQINFRYGRADYRAEVTLDSDLQLDEILEVERVAPSGAVYAVADVSDLEDAIGDEIGRRTAELRSARDAARSRGPSKRRPVNPDGRRLVQEDANAVADTILRDQRAIRRTVVQIPLAEMPAPAVESHLTLGAANADPEVNTVVAPIPGAPEVVQNKEHSIMQFNLKGVAAKTGRATFQQDGGKNVVKFGKTAFEGGVIPDSITIEAPFAVKVAKVKMTAEERKAYNASKPKPTKAEKLTALKARAAKLEAELAL